MQMAKILGVVAMFGVAAWVAMPILDLTTGEEFAGLHTPVSAEVPTCDSTLYLEEVELLSGAGCS